MKKNLVLLGMMAVGKRTLGKIVAKKLNLQFIDTDKNIESSNAMKIKVPYMDLHNHTVWGATGVILSEFKDLIS